MLQKSYTQAERDQFYKDVELAGIKKLGAKLARLTGLSSGNVSEYLNRKKEASDKLINAFYENFGSSIIPLSATNIPADIQEAMRIIARLTGQQDRLLDQQDRLILQNEKLVDSNSSLVRQSETLVNRINSGKNDSASESDQGGDKDIDPTELKPLSGKRNPPGSSGRKK